MWVWSFGTAGRLLPEPSATESAAAALWLVHDRVRSPFLLHGRSLRHQRDRGWAIHSRAKTLLIRLRPLLPAMRLVSVWDGSRRIHHRGSLARIGEAKIRPAHKRTTAELS